MDSSIRLQSGALKPLFETLKNTGMLTQFINLKLTSYTDRHMFTWFGESVSDYERFYTIEANLIMYCDTFVSSLMMRAWIACALVSVVLKSNIVHDT